MGTFFRKHFFCITVISLLLLGGLLRFYQIGEVPHGMTWDEAAIGYNGYAVITTRRDEWLHRLPISFRSFGDYKAPFSIYLTGLFTTALGLELWVVRLPFVLIGTSAILAMILLIKEYAKLSGLKKRYQQWLPLIGGLLLTFSPWHLHYSRTGFESGIALAWTLWAFYFLLRSLRTQKYTSLFVSGFFFVLTLYTYHSSKIVSPLLIVLFAVLFSKKILQRKKHLVLALAPNLILLVPLLKDSFLGKGLERASTLVIHQSNSMSELLSLLFTQFIAHLTPQFLVLGQITSYRHGDGVWGVLLPTTFLLLLFSLVVFAYRLYQKKSSPFQLFFFLWILIGIVPAALGSELVPHSNRALLALPGFILFIISCLPDLSKFLVRSKINKNIIGSHGEKNMVWISVVGTLLFLHGLFFVTYLDHYYAHFSKQSAADFSDGYLEAFDYVTQFEKEKEKIVFTDEYGQPYIFALFSRKTNPIWYQGGSLIKYEFTEVDVGDLQRTNAVIVAGQDSEFMNPDNADKLIYGSDGEIRFKIYIK